MPKSLFSYSRLGADEHALLATLSQRDLGRDGHEAAATQLVLQAQAEAPMRHAATETAVKARVTVFDMA